jgi:hypothetical protein
MKNEIKTETEITAQMQNSPKQSRIKKLILNLIAVMIGFMVILGVLGGLDILAQRELKKTGDALPKLFLYRWKSNDNSNDNVLTQFRQFSQLAANDPLNGPTRDLKNLFPNLVDDHLPYIIANYFKIFIRQSSISNFETHSKMQPDIITPELLSKLERPFIVCLGGSTTEPFLATLKKEIDEKWSIVANGTWSEELTRIMENKQIHGTIFCGGTGDYNTSNDLLKLLRDVLEIRPDIVISYGGVNDLCRRRDFKMYSYKYYQSLTKPQLGKSSIFPNLIRYISIKYISKKKIERKPIELYGGVKSNLNETEYMIRNWKIMNEICKLHEIKFYGVCQPCIGSTELTRNNEELIFNKWSGLLHDDTLWHPCFDVLVKNYDQIRTEILQHDFMYDFSDIFDNHDLNIIYPYHRDIWHISQEGNRIVAEKMFEMLFDESNGTQNDSDK